MRKLRFMVLTTLAAVTLTLSGCVELDGQRLTWFHDPAKDELQILLHYDGVHDSGSDGDGKGVEQIPKFVNGGDVLLWDWPFHLEMDQVREAAEDKDTKPQERELAKALLSIKVQPVGYYREPNGKIGAAELITIPNAKALVRKLNAMINAKVTEAEATPDIPLARTVERMRTAAKKNHQWIALDGHAVRVVLPVHRREWDRQKGQFLNELASYAAEALGDKSDEQVKRDFQIWLGLLASTPLSYIDEGDEVEFVIGRTKMPSTVRTNIRDKYEPSLEKVLIDTVKVDLDEQLAAALLNKDANPSAPVAAVVRFGPPEDQVRALLAAAENGDGQRQQAAIKRLREWAEQWNRDQAIPKAPRSVDNAGDYLAAWKTWYAAMKRYPSEKHEE
jgi:hypothetical protein